MAIVLARPPGDIDLTQGLISGSPYIAQRIKWRLRFFRGEWFLDQREGVPYFRDIFRKGVDLVVARSILKRVIEETPGVLSVERFDIRPGTKARQVLVEFGCTTTDGPVDDDLAFLV